MLEHTATKKRRASNTLLVGVLLINKLAKADKILNGIKAH